jgi:hypothetical protein
MKTILLCLLVATGVSVAIRLMILRVGVEAAETQLADSATHPGEISGPTKTALVIRSGTRAPHSQTFDPESQRVIGDLIASGQTPEEAQVMYQRIPDYAQAERAARVPMPGVLTNVPDPKRWPLFGD